MVEAVPDGLDEQEAAGGFAEELRFVSFFLPGFVEQVDCLRSRPAVTEPRAVKNITFQRERLRM